LVIVSLVMDQDVVEHVIFQLGMRFI